MGQCVSESAQKYRSSGDNAPREREVEMRIWNIFPISSIISCFFFSPSFARPSEDMDAVTVRGPRIDVVLRILLSQTHARVPIICVSYAMM